MLKYPARYHVKPSLVTSFLEVPPLPSSRPDVARVCLSLCLRVVRVVRVVLVMTLLVLVLCVLVAGGSWLVTGALVVTT